MIWQLEIVLLHHHLVRAEQIPDREMRTGTRRILFQLVEERGECVSLDQQARKSAPGRPPQAEVSQDCDFLDHRPHRFGIGASSSLDGRRPSRSSRSPEQIERAPVLRGIRDVEVAGPSPPPTRPGRGRDRRRGPPRICVREQRCAHIGPPGDERARRALVAGTYSRRARARPGSPPRAPVRPSAG